MEHSQRKVLFFSRAILYIIINGFGLAARFVAGLGGEGDETMRNTILIFFFGLPVLFALIDLYKLDHLPINMSSRILISILLLVPIVAGVFFLVS